jgi:hypothetical protein
MNCPTCGKDNPEDAQFCGVCGTNLISGETVQRHSFVERMVGAALLKRDIYEEVEADKSATASAALVVVLASLASGVGAYVVAGLPGLVAGVVIGVMGWAVWAGITFLIGTQLLSTPNTQADWGQMARTLGFAQAPGLLRIFGVLPGVGPSLLFVVGIWGLVAMVVAVRQALDYESTGRAVAVVAAGFFPYLIFAGFMWSITGLIFGAETVELGTQATEGS